MSHLARPVKQNKARENLKSYREIAWIQYCISNTAQQLVEDT